MLALIAGTGALPGILLDRLAARGEDALVCEMDGFPVEVAASVPRLRFRIETLGTLIATLRARGVTRVCLAGAVRRPDVDPAVIDDATYPLVPRLQAAMRHGDDGTLREVIAIFEEAGLEVVAAHQIAPDLLPQAGVLGRHRPDARHIADAARAEAVVRAMAVADVGQACVVRDGQVIAVEAGPGTDWMLQSLYPAAEPAAAAAGGGRAGQGGSDPLLWAVDTATDIVGGWADWLTGPGEQGRPKPASRPDDTASPDGQAAKSQAAALAGAYAATTSQGGSAPPIAQGGVFFKAPKPGQDRRADLPTIGPASVAGAACAGLSAVVVEAQGVMILDLPQVVQLADSHGLVLWVREATAR